MEADGRDVILAALTTDRLILRAFEAGDAARLIEVANQPEIRDGTISVPPFDAVAARAWLAERAVAGGERASWAIARREAPERLVGYIGLHAIDAVHREAELSFWIDAAEQGLGLAFEAATEIIAYAFQQLGLNRLCAFHMVRNAASARLLQRLGFQREGLLRERVWKNGRFEDVFLLSRLVLDP